MFTECKIKHQKTIQDLDLLIARSKKTQVLVPVFKWGQNKEEIFMEIKMSHRFDAPGCLESYEPSQVDELVQIKDGKIN